jgi:hypothetical protein
MLDRMRSFLARRARHAAAVRAATAHCRSTGRPVLGGEILEDREPDMVVRLLLRGTVKPPVRAWFLVIDGNAPEELSYEDVASLEPGPWR